MLHIIPFNLTDGNAKFTFYKNVNELDIFKFLSQKDLNIILFYLQQIFPDYGELFFDHNRKICYKSELAVKDNRYSTYPLENAGALVQTFVSVSVFLLHHKKLVSLEKPLYLDSFNNHVGPQHTYLFFIYMLLVIKYSKINTLFVSFTSLKHKNVFIELLIKTKINFSLLEDSRLE